MSIASHRSRARRGPNLVVEVMEARSLLTSMAVINWSMAPQIANDPAHGNAPDLPNTSAYVNPPNGYQVLLDASKSTGITANSTFTWTITPVTGSPIVVTGETPSVDLQQGSYGLKLEADNLKGTTGPSVADSPLAVKDVLIVSIGASYASGEGSPVVDGNYKATAPQWAYSPDPAMELENADAHRSTLAGPAQFALQLQEANPHEAVTFVSVASSGATIANGLLGPMPSIGDPNEILPAQLAEVAAIVGSHPIDVLTMTIGADDIAITKLFYQLAANTRSDDTTTLASIEGEANSGLAALPSQFAALGPAIRALNPAHVMITEYPDPVKNSEGEFVPLTLGGVRLLGASQAQFFSQDIVAPLDGAIEAAADANSWTFVGGISADFKTHGYPAANPWINSFPTSFQIEGSPDGALHPNAAGQQDIARHLLSTYEQIETDASGGGLHILGFRQRNHHARRRA